MMRTLSCGILGSDSPSFTVELGTIRTVEELRNAVASAPQVNADPNDVTLYWVKEETRGNQDEQRKSLQLRVESGVLVEMDDCFSVSFYRYRFDNIQALACPSVNESGAPHIMVQIHSQEEELEPSGAGEDVGLAELWKYSMLELDKLPIYDDLSYLLQRRLPFRVRVRDQQTANMIFSRAGPVIRCDALSSFIDVLVMSHEALPDEGDTKHSRQKFDDLLFAFTAQICRANGVRLKVERKDPTEDASTGESLRSDLTVYCNGCVVLCGEERGESADMNDTIAKLGPKMECWGPQFVGELPYMLGYVGCGNRRKLFAYRFKPCFSLCEVFSPMAIKVFYNLAFLLSFMATKSKLIRPSRLSPYKRHQTETGTIELVVWRTQIIIIRRDYCTTGDAYKRIVAVYKNLQAIHDKPASLPSVGSLKQTNFPSRKTVVQLYGEGFYRLPENDDEVSRWLLNMLHALQAWHESGYCHGDIRWENMVYAPGPRMYDNNPGDPDYQNREACEVPGYWMLVNLESSRRSSLLMQEQDSASEFTCQSDLFQLGSLMKTLEFPLTHRLLWIRQKLLSARDRTEEVTARRVLAMLNRTKKCQSDDVQSVANVILSALHTPEMTPESMLVMMKELVPPAQVKASESSGLGELTL